MEASIPLMKSVFLYAARNKAKIITVFRFLYVFIFILWVAGFFLSTRQSYFLTLYDVALWCGRTALVLFCITITPGILKRFGKTWNIRTILMLLRRQFGVLTFFIAFLHFSLLRLFPYINGDYILRFPLLNFELFGLLSIFFMSLLFFTSNDYSVRSMGKWWTILHNLIYIVAWTIALHVALVRTSTYSYIIIAFAVIETISLIYFYLIPKRTVIPPPVKPAV
jgi:DMSO/TMAO reductase YedYZ heme-binding membrane subunit